MIPFIFIDDSAIIKFITKESILTAIVTGKSLGFQP